MNWLITGGCGFIGVNLIERLLQDGGNRIRVLDNLSVGTRDDLSAVTQFTELPLAPLTGRSELARDLHTPRRASSTQPNFFPLTEKGSTTPSPLMGESTLSAPSPLKGEGWGEGGNKVQLIVGDILDEQLTKQVAANTDVIVHLAANTGVGPSVENPRQDCITNVIGTLNMLEAARHSGVKRFVFASSGAPVGEVEPPIHEELAPHPVSPYGASKLAGEGYCSAYYRTFGVETVALRFGNVYGPRSSHKSSVVAKFIRRAISGESLEIYGDGKQTRDFIYIADLVQAIELSATKPDVGGEVFQIATSAETTVSEISQLLLPLLANAGIKGPEILHGKPRLGDVRRNYSSTLKAKSILGWSAATTLEVGLSNTVAWFRQA